MMNLGPNFVEDEDQQLLNEMDKRLDEMRLQILKNMEKQKQCFDDIRNGILQNLESIMTKFFSQASISPAQAHESKPSPSLLPTALIIQVSSPSSIKTLDPPDLIHATKDAPDCDVPCFEVCDSLDQSANTDAEGKSISPLEQNLEHLEGKKSQKVYAEVLSQVGYSLSKEHQENSVVLIGSLDEAKRIWEPSDLSTKLDLLDLPKKSIQKKSHRMVIKKQNHHVHKECEPHYLTVDICHLPTVTMCSSLPPAKPPDLPCFNLFTTNDDNRELYDRDSLHKRRENLLMSKDDIGEGIHSLSKPETESNTPKFEVVSWDQEKLRTFDRRVSNKTLSLEDKKEDGHKQKKVMALISSLDNQMWEPGGESMKLEKWKGSEKCYKYDMTRFMQDIMWPKLPLKHGISSLKTTPNYVEIKIMKQGFQVKAFSRFRTFWRSKPLMIWEDKRKKSKRWMALGHLELVQTLHQTDLVKIIESLPTLINDSHISLEIMWSNILLSFCVDRKELIEELCHMQNINKRLMTFNKGERAALNLDNQKFSKFSQKLSCLIELLGYDMIGLSLRSSLSVNNKPKR